MLEAILVGIIDAVLLRKTMQFCSGVDTSFAFGLRQVGARRGGARRRRPLRKT